MECLPELPGGQEPVTDYGDRLILQSFSDLHLHGPQFPQVGMGMDLPLLDWLNTYTFPLEARFADLNYARSVYERLAKALIDGGTTRVAMFSSLHTDATLVLMEELERAGVTGYVGKVNMDRNGGVNLQETTEESKRETLRWLESCQQFRHIQPILTPRFTPSCTDELMAWLGNLAQERGFAGPVPFERKRRGNCLGPGAATRIVPSIGRRTTSTACGGPRTLMAHCVHSDRRERTAMRDHGVTVVHCADSNLNLCSGTAPVRQLLQEGVNVVLGSDIAGGAQLLCHR